MPTLCLCGIDTGIGKSVATGLLARHLLEDGHSVITQKLVQTGCSGRPEDVLTHRRLMETGWLEEDEQKLTCPYCFSFPGSPHLAARIAQTTIEPEKISVATRQLQASFEWVILEGAGGLLVPLGTDLNLLDYIAFQEYPLILVTSSRLGSINHTLMSLESIRSRNINLVGLIYNIFDGGPDAIIQDSLRLFSRALQDHGFKDNILVLPPWPHSRTIEWYTFLNAIG